MVKDKSETTLVNQKKINTLLEKDPTSKEVLIQKLGCSSKTLERAKSTRSNKTHRINKDVVARLAEHLKVNYSELIITDESISLPEEINRTDLHKVITINELFEKLNQSDVIENIYECSVYEEISQSINNIFDMAHHNNSKNYSTINSSELYGTKKRVEDEKKYLEILSSGNLSLEYLWNQKIDVYAGFYIINLIGIENFEDFDGEIFANYRFWKPKKIKKGVILFSNRQEQEIKMKTFYPNKGFTSENLYRVYKELLQMYELKDREYVLKYFFKNFLNIPVAEQLNYSEMPKITNLPQLSSESIAINAEFIKVVEAHLAINDNLNENELPKYSGIINSIPEKINETKGD